MAFAFLPFPYLNTYTLLTQFILLLAFVAVSYLYRRPRLVLVALILIYTIFKITVPLARWGYAAFKAIALFGFYVHFFIVGAGYIFVGAAAVWNFPELLKTFVDSLEGR
ncbi:hypothetical protein B0H17DRAFT_1073011 [Mycena rosella]|uniref:Uncharacterized protein n=1 Tax=Mycena rosella TaxID=1033263 RepID=A0AAD7DCD0_MYCRO|nr:hypothetical protein B0H17DRAFT_1073011 [Mycena rosella]